MKNIIVIDGLAIKSKEDFHIEIAKKADFGPYYGRNLDALWDRLYRDWDEDNILQWDNSEYSKNAMGKEEFQRIIDLFDEVIKTNLEKNLRNNFAYILN